MFKIAALRLVGALTARAAVDSAYPDLDDFQYVNYAEPQQVVYDYVDHGYSGGGAYEDSNRYQMDEKPRSEYDYSSRDYVVVEEGTEGSYTEMGGWHYDGGHQEVHHYHHDDRDRYERRRHDSYYRGDDSRYNNDRYDSGRYDYGYSRNEYRQPMHYSSSGGDFVSSFVPIVCIILAIGATVFAVVQYREAQRQKRISEAMNTVQVLNKAPVEAIDTQGKPLLFSGACLVDGPVTDAEFGVVTSCHPIMYRDVEVFQWTERKENIEERRGNQVRKGVKYHYKAQWDKTAVNSNNFKDPKYRQNISPTVSSKCIRGGQVRVGNFYSVAIDEFVSAFGLTSLRDLNMQGGGPSAEFDRDGIWSIDSRNNCLVRQRNPGKDTVGDIRIRYRVLNQFEQAASGAINATVCGVPRGNQIQKWDSLNGVVIKGTESLASFLQKRAV